LVRHGYVSGLHHHCHPTEERASRYSRPWQGRGWKRAARGQDGRPRIGAFVMICVSESLINLCNGFNACLHRLIAPGPLGALVLSRSNQNERLDCRVLPEIDGDLGGAWEAAGLRWTTENRRRKKKPAALLELGLLIQLVNGFHCPFLFSLSVKVSSRF
jgi:hypothetical protein